VLLRLEAEQALLGVGRRSGSRDDVNNALFKLLDTNGDGKLTRAKLAAAATVLMKLDRNDDEMIVPAEILQSAVAANPDQATLEELRALRFALILQEQELLARRGSGRGRGGPFWLVAPGEASPDLAREMQRYAHQVEGQPRSANKISRTELGLDEATFRLLDIDGDGFLDTEELARFAHRDPDLEINIRLGKNAGVELIRRKAPLESKVRPGKDGALILDLGGVRFDLKSLATSVKDRKAQAEQERKEILAFFKEADRDKNGYLDMSEAMRHPYFRNVFKAMDRDGDGMLFEKEVIAYLDAYQELQALAAASCVSVSSAMEGKGLFELIDTNGDGRLSVREMRNAVKLLEDLDRDGKGFLTKTDIPRCSTATFRTGPATTDRSDRYYASQALVVRSGRRIGNTQPTQPPRGPAWFVKMDRNGDGDVSRKEFLGTDEQFKEIDTDGDGLISLEEAEAYDKKMREMKK
jgi:Ca2+-binding EF-hand superfamily protein